MTSVLECSISVASVLLRLLKFDVKISFLGLVCILVVEVVPRAQYV